MTTLCSPILGKDFVVFTLAQIYKDNTLDKDTGILKMADFEQKNSGKQE